MKITAEQLQERYRSMNTEKLIDIAGNGGLTDMAFDVMRSVLADRGISLEQAIAHSRSSETRPVSVAWAGATKRFPRIWIGYLIAILSFLAEIAEAILYPELENNFTLPLTVHWPVIMLWFSGLSYWCFSIYRLHWIVAEATAGSYPISPSQAGGFQFIPLFNWYWNFRWPAVLGRSLKENGVQTALGGWLGVPILFGFLVVKLISPAIGLMILFWIMNYVVGVTRRAASANSVKSEA